MIPVVPDWLGQLLFGIRHFLFNGTPINDSSTVNVASPLTATYNGTTGNIDLGVSASTLTGVIPATPSTVVERDSGGQGFFVGLDVGAGSLVNVGPFVAFAAATTSPTVGQSTVAGTGASAGQTLAVVGQFGQNQTGGANNNNGGDVVVKGGAAGTGGGGTAGQPGSVYIRGSGGIVIAVTGTGFLGFYNKTPVTQASRAGQLTDSTGGTPGTTLAAVAAGALYDQADMVAVKNALASLSAKYDALELAIHNLGLTA